MKVRTIILALFILGIFGYGGILLKNTVYQPKEKVQNDNIQAKAPIKRVHQIVATDNISMSDFKCLMKQEGDANCDNVINIYDYNIVIIQSIMPETLTANNLIHSDFNQDGIVNNSDKTIWVNKFKNSLSKIK